MKRTFSRSLLAFAIFAIGSVAVLSQVEPAGERNENCLCTLDYRPVCDENNDMLAPNACSASCAGYTEDQIKRCKRAEPANVPEEDCLCTFIYQPVCEASGLGLPIAANACGARCLGYDDSQFEPCYNKDAQAANTEPGILSVKDCVCTEIYLPVCDKFGNEVAPNACSADCDGIIGYAPCEDFSSHADVILPAGPPMPQPCMTTMEYAPVCTSNGKQVGSNKGDAMCKGYTEEQLEPCYPAEEPQGSVSSADECICTLESLPMCLRNGTEVGANPCVAACNGFGGQAVPCEVLQLVKPAVPVDIEPKPVCLCTTEYNPQCDINTGFEVASNPCNAECLGYNSSQVEDCDQKEPFGRTAGKLCKCTRDYRPVCDELGTQLGSNACTAECKGYSPEDFSQENCAVEPPPCQKACTRDYRPVCDKYGTELGANACVAEFCNGYNTSDFSEEYCSPGYVRTSVLTSLAANGPCKCTKDYLPVCAIDGSWTMSNSCTAQCAGFAPSEFALCQVISLLEAANSTLNARTGSVGPGSDANLQTVCIEPQLAAGPLLCAQYDTALGSNLTNLAIEGPGCESGGCPTISTISGDDSAATRASAMMLTAAVALATKFLLF